MGSLIHSITKSKTGNSNKVVIPPEILSDIYGDGNIMETSGPHSLEISGFTYFAIGESTSRYTNSLCYFKDLGITNIGVILYFIEKDDGQMVAYIRPLPTRSINDNFQEVQTLKDPKSFQYYRILLPSYSLKPLLINVKAIIRKCFTIDVGECTFMVPIIHVFEHN